MEHMASCNRQLFVLLASCTTVYIIHSLFYSEYKIKTGYYVNTKISTNSLTNLSDNVIILFWNAPHWIRELYSGVNISSCSISLNCTMSFDRDMFNKSSSVVFSLPNEGLDKPPVDYNNRNPNQRWIFFTLESPMNLNHMYKKDVWRNVFNLSWTYQSDSDIVFPYGSISQRQKVVDKNYSTIFRGKKKFAAWVVSHCRTQSKREKYVKILQKYIDIDIFGKCGQTGKMKRKTLEKLINRNYKFYLSFENAHCKDYVTEKFFYYYNLDVITVLRGAVNYGSQFPKDAFINTADFSSVQSLANHLKHLAENEEEYVRYLRYKDRFVAHDYALTFQYSFCNLCMKSNMLDGETRMYGDVESWLGQCNNISDLNEY